MPLPRLPIAACLVLIPIVLPTAAHAQRTGGASTSSSLDLSLDTGSPLSRESTPRSPYRSQLASRSGMLIRREAPRQVVLGRLAVVSSERTAIRQGRDSGSRQLSVAGAGTYLAIISEVGDHYGILMIDRSTGWVAKSAVRMIDYQAAVGDPNTVAPPAATTPPPSAGPDRSAELPPNLDERQVALLREAFSYLGVPYVWAGNTRSGLDCSGFVKNVFSTQGVSLPRHSGDQARVGTPVAWEDLRAGDRLYFDMGLKGRVSHTGIYLGNGYFIHASSNQRKVGVDSLLKPNYYKSLVGARRS